MPLSLSADDQKRAIASIRRFATEHLDIEVGDIQATLVLSFFLKELAPTFYNNGVADAQVFLRDRVADLEGACSEPEFAFWPKGTSVRRK